MYPSRKKQQLQVGGWGWELRNTLQICVSFCYFPFFFMVLGTLVSRTFGMPGKPSTADLHSQPRVKFIFILYFRELRIPW